MVIQGLGEIVRPQREQVGEEGSGLQSFGSDTRRAPVHLDRAVEILQWAREEAAQILENLGQTGPLVPIVMRGEVAQ